MSVRLAVLGAGRWGKNLVRAFAALPGVQVALVVDPSEEARRRAEAHGFRTAAEPGAAFEDPAIDAVAVAAPAEQHASLTIAGLSAGKHVFVEKPLCMSTAEGVRLRLAAQATDRVLMVGHLMLYHPAVHKLRELVRGGELGETRTITATRVNFGTVRTHENAWWSLAPHDVSMILDLVGGMPSRISARGAAHLNPAVEDVVFAHLEFPAGVLAAVHVSWLHPLKRRELTIVGSRRMAIFDDMAASEKVRVFDVASEPTLEFESFAEFVARGHGDIVSPQLSAEEPLRLELLHFVRCIVERTPPRTGIEGGLDVVRVLEAGQRSLRSGGASVPVEDA